jgi:hypothetical protein
MMAQKHLQRDPHNISEHCWWYEENGGISIVHEPTGDKHAHINISWTALRNALKRKDKQP